MGVEPSRLEATRTGVHGIAEHLLAAQQRRANGSIRLEIRDGALSTQDLPGPVSRLELRSSALVRHPDGLVVPVHGTLGGLAAALGIEFGMPDPPYPPASGCGPDHEPVLDPAALSVIEDSWRVGDRALRAFGSQPPVVWPEHLDVAVRLDDVNYGVSPGDGYLGRPYAYVGLHSVPGGDFWNAPFGAARGLDDLSDAGDDPDLAVVVRAFFEQGRSGAGSG